MKEMKKAEIIAKYGEEAYERQLEQMRARYKAHREEDNARSKKYREEHKEEERARKKKYNEEHPEKAIARNQEQNRKGSKYYDRNLKKDHTGLRGARGRIRMKHGRQYKPYKNIIAPNSQIHHEWLPQTSEYRGIALVEKDAHMHGFVNVIDILDGNITLLTEEEIRKVRREPEGL